MDALNSDDVQATPATVKSELEEPTELGRFYFDAATLTVSEAKRFHDFFKVDCLEEWVLEKTYRVFQAWDSRKVQEENEDIDPDTLGFAVLKEYREFYIAPEFIGHPYFELDNLSTWFKPEAFRAFESYSHLWKARTSSPARSHEDIELVMLTVKFCYIHFVRNIEKIAGLERDQIARLKSFSGLSTDEDVQEWHEFCKRLSQNSKAMKGWYEHKIAHPYLLTCVNKHLSLMAGTSWDITPKDANLVEGAHAGRNADTGTNLALLEGIFLLAQELETRATELVAHRHMNGLQIRKKKSKARKDRISKQARERQDHVDNYFDLQAQVTSLMTSKSNSAALTKQLNAELAKIKDQLKITRTPSLEVQKSTLQARLDGEVTKRRTWTADAKEIRLQMEALQQGPLKGVSKERFRSDSSDDRIEDTLEVPDSETRERSPSVLPSESATGSDVVEQDDHIGMI
ncbi:hypothetical protein DFP72DRAFT_1146978 [Ephemerocybe angulata]|uniref:Uncharacterized protein n=1 Tax=Ephemerocybe angulata TaxID=980116 RepID=A0A8H6M0M8_9AGAR|nr:hypothetical protein DFP72DRAFT_1146978 [Tulosesus angulatus]